MSLRAFFNSDAVYLPSVFSDIFISHHHFTSWFFTPAPYFFPDMFVFFGINTFIHSVFYSIIIYAVFQSLLTLFIISKIAYLVTKQKSSILWTHIVFLLILVYPAMKSLDLFGASFKSACHFGTIINGLLLLLCIMKYCKKPLLKYLIVIFSLAILGAASDLLFIVQFIIPIIAAFIIFKMFKMKVNLHIFKISLILIAGSLMGCSAKYFFILGNNSNYILQSPKKITLVFEGFLQKFKLIFLQNPIFATLVLVFYVILAVTVIHERRKKAENFIECEERNYVFFLGFFVFLSMLCTLGNFVINHLFITTRYLLPVFFLPIALCWLPFTSIFKSLAINRILMTALFLILFLAMAEKLYFRTPYQYGYYPQQVFCIDSGIKEYNSHRQEKIEYGISAYWLAKSTAILSKEGIVISQYEENLKRRLWITTSENYRDRYDFAITSNQGPGYMLDINLIKHINGEPITSFECGNDITVLIYGKDRLRVVTEGY